MTIPLAQFREVWCADFEFCAAPGERPVPHCLVAHEVHSSRTVRLWLDGSSETEAPWEIGRDSLFIAYYASAELGCMLALGWPMPARILDLYAEFRCLTNGVCPPHGYGLLGALAYFGLDALDAVEKESMRQLALRGGPYSEHEREALLAYCESDVRSLVALLCRMQSLIDRPRALLRGRYMAAVARIEHHGVPIDQGRLSVLRQSWDGLKVRLVEVINADFGVFETTATGPVFRRSLFQEWLVRNQIPWQLLESGELDLSDDTFRQAARQHPLVAPLRELRYSLSQLRLNDLAVGRDGRNRCLLSPFASKTSRNQPSNSRYIFGPSCWLRALIQPSPGRAVAYVDWEQQEFGIAAALSGDTKMQAAYLSGDPYLAFAKQAGAVPQDATKTSHPTEREQFKICALGVQYGMGDQSLAALLGMSTAHSRELLQLHRQTYPRFWSWSQAVVDHAMLHGWLQTVFGWRVHVGPDANPRSLANFPMQANGAEMLRLACCLATEASVMVCAPVHDAVLIEGDSEDIDTEVWRMQAIMRGASEIVLAGFPLRTDVKVIRHPNRYLDPRGVAMWEHISALVAEPHRPNGAQNNP